jgi:hypothetical protein
VATENPGRFNPLEHSGPVQACIGIIVHLPFGDEVKNTIGGTCSIRGDVRDTTISSAKGRLRIWRHKLMKMSINNRRYENEPAGSV